MSTQLALPLDQRPARGQRPRSVRVRNSYYDAGATSRRTRGWQAPTSSPNTAVLWDLTQLRDRSRAACRNDGFAIGVIRALVNNIVGTGIKPLSQADGKAFRKAVHELWLRWTDESDADGLLDFYGQQAQAVRCWLEAGEVFIRIRPRFSSDGLAVPLQLQVIEPELCPHTENALRPNGNKVRAGIEFNRIGRRVAYYFHPFRPGEFTEYDRGVLQRVPASSVIHLYDPGRAGQIRGLPHLTQALIKLYELDKYDDATLLRQQIANLFAGFLTKALTPDDQADYNPLTGMANDTTQEGRPVVSLEPGTMQELAAGEKVEWADPPDPPATYPHFMKQQLRAVAGATGVPYEVLTGDLTGLNDRVMRVILHEFRRRIQGYQHQIVAHQLCRRVWLAWLERAFLSGALPIPISFLEDPEPWARVRWMPQSWPYIHPVQDVDASIKAIRGGLTSRSTVISETGEDPEAIDNEQAADNERADELGLKYDSDGRKASGSASGGSQPPQPGDPDDGLDPDEREDRLENEPPPSPEPEPGEENAA